MSQFKSYGYALLGAIVGALILYLVGGQDEEYVVPFFLIGLNGALLSLPIARVLAGEIRWYSPHAVILAAFFMMYVAAPTVAIWVGPESAYYERDLTGAELTKTLGIFSLGIFCYLLGYKIGPKKAKLPRGIEWYFTDTPQVQAAFPFLCLFVWGCGMAAWAYSFATVGLQNHLSNFGGSRAEMDAAATGIVIHIAKWSWVGVLLWFSRYGVRPMSFIMFMGLFCTLLLYGSRSYIAILLLGCFIVWRFRMAKRVPITMWVTMAAALVILMSGYVILRQTNADVSKAYRIWQESTETTEGRIQAFTEAFEFIGPAAETINELGGKIELQYGRTFGTILFVIPSRIWPQQTELFESASRVYTESLFPHRADKITMTPTIMVEFFVNFSWPGVAICSLIMGWIVRWFGRLVADNDARKHQVAWIAYSAVVTVNLLRVMKNGVGTIIFAFYFAVPVVIVYAPNLSLLFSPPPIEDEFESDHGTLEPA